MTIFDTPETRGIGILGRSGSGCSMSWECHGLALPSEQTQKTIPKKSDNDGNT